MIINKDVVAIDEAFNRYVKICKEIGRTDERIEVFEAEQYLNKLRGDNHEPMQYSIDRLKKYRAGLEDDKSRAEVDIYKRFEHYYS